MTLTLDERPPGALITGEHLAELTDVVAFLYAELHLGPAVELSISLVDQTEMERLHLQWMDLPGATDVLSFPMDELSPGTAESPVAQGTLGDIVLCPPVAAAQAAAAGHTMADELCLLTTHGVLHLLGFDHHDAAEKTEMFALQSQLLTSYLGRQAPTPTETGT